MTALVGFTFANNQGQSWHSEPAATTTTDPNDPSQTISTTTYTVAKQNNQDEWLYSATGMFTYPMFENGDIENGPTAGIGANSNSILVYLGYGVVIHENILISAGAIIQEFETLSGTYKEGQELGETAIDSSTLTSKTFDISYGLTIGYRFGN